MVDMGETLTTFGAQCTGDHLIRQRGLESEDDASYEGANSALVLYDRGTDWLDCYPSATRSIEHTVEAFKQWAGSKEKIQAFYCDNAHELIGAARKCGWRCATATTGIHQTNGLAERMVRKSKEGGRCNIVQSGLSGKWWPEGIRTYCFAHSVELLDGDSPYNRRHGKGALRTSHVGA